MWNRAKGLVKQDTEAEHAPIDHIVDDLLEAQEEIVNTNMLDEDTPEKRAERAWKAKNPDKTLNVKDNCSRPD